MDAHEDRNLVATLYVNRASVLHVSPILDLCGYVPNVTNSVLYQQISLLTVSVSVMCNP